MTLMSWWRSGLTGVTGQMGLGLEETASQVHLKYLVTGCWSGGCIVGGRGVCRTTGDKASTLSGFLLAVGSLLIFYNRM